MKRKSLFKGERGKVIQSPYINEYGHKWDNLIQLDELSKPQPFNDDQLAEEEY